VSARIRSILGAIPGAIPAIVLTIVTVGLALAIVYAWVAQKGAGATCDATIPGEIGYFDDSLRRSTSENDRAPGYLSVELREQEPVEPIFNGQLYYQIDNGVNANKVNVEISGDQNYGDSVREIDADKNATGLTVEDLGLIPVSGSHRRFPFDSAEFNFNVTTDPPLHINTVRVVNRVSGFVLDCQTVSPTAIGDGKTKIQFRLRRNPLIQLTAIVLLSASLAFAVLILRSKTIEALSGAAASSFFSMWSIRSILSSQIRTFPTVLDLAILTMSMLLLLLVLWRTLVGPAYQKKPGYTSVQRTNKKRLGRYGLRGKYWRQR
jgi:hypothetical protein